VPVYPPVDDRYASLTPAELAAFGISPARAPCYTIKCDTMEDGLTGHASEGNLDG
jgi:hypothetical protein